AASGLAVVTVGEWLRTGAPKKRIAVFSVLFGAMCLFSVVTVGISASYGIGLATRAGSILSSVVQRPNRTDEVVHHMGAAFTVRIFDTPYAHFEALAICLAIVCLLRAPLFALMFLLTSFANALFISWAYGGAAWHFGAVYVLFIAMYIIKSKETVVIAGRALLLTSFLGGLLMLKPLPPYSRGQEAADIISQRRLEFRHWSAYPAVPAAVTFAVLGRSFHSFECDCEFTYINWGLYRSRLGQDALRERIRRFVEIDERNNSYLLVSQAHAAFLRSVISPDFWIEEIADTGPAAYQDESFFLWRVTKWGR